MPTSKQTLARIAIWSLYVPGAEYVCLLGEARV